VDGPFDPNMSENRHWLSVADLLGPFADAKIAVLGVPLGAGSLTPGRCDLAPETIRAALQRISSYDLETRTDLSLLRIYDAGDAAIGNMPPAEAFASIKQAVAEQANRRKLVLILGGNNAITRPGVHGMDATLSKIGLLTLDAHFDLRDTDQELNNGNPIQALLEDGLNGAHISQIGLAPFANTRKAHQKAIDAGIAVHTLADCRRHGLCELVARELERLAGMCEQIYADCDIDAIDRAQMPAAPGARPGGLGVDTFLAAARLIASHPKVTCMDLTEFDPALDVGAIGALTAARWVAEAGAGFLNRSGNNITP
jgi:formiminoglutamase